MPQARSQSHILGAREHNSRHAPILHLPSEIFLMVLFYFTNSDADNVGLMALRATCVRLSTLITRPLTIGSVLQQKYSHFLRSQKLAAICQLEREDLLPKGELACAACLNSHPSSSFFPAAVKYLPETRKCRGSIGYLHLCHHMSISYEQLQTGGRQFWCGLHHGNSDVQTHYGTSRSLLGGNQEGWYSNMRNWKDNEPVRSYQARVKRIGPLNVNQRGVFLGPKSVYDEIYGQLDRERETAKQEREYWPKSKRKQARKEKGAAIKTGGNENLILRAEYIVLRSKIEPRLYSMFLPTDQIASHTRRTLTIADGGFVSVHRPCPHLHSAGISAFLHAHRDPGTPWGEHLPCPNAQCQTTLRFEIDKGAYSPIAGIQGKYGKIEPIDEVLLIVERNLGPVRDVMDERWASQLEESHH